MLLLCLCSGVTQLCLKTFVRRPWSCRLNALAQCVYVKGPDVKGQLSATRRRSSQLPDSRTSILRLTVSQTSLSSSSTNGTESDTKLPGFLKFLTSCRNLLSLGLQIPAINDDDLWILSKQCPSLQRLTIVSVPHLSWARISDEGLAAVCKQAKDLRHIHVKVQQEQQRAGPLDGERRMRNAQDDESASGWVISERYVTLHPLQIHLEQYLYDMK